MFDITRNSIKTIFVKTRVNCIVFRLVSDPGADSILKLQGTVLNGVWRVKEEGNYWRVACKRGG